MVFIYCFDDYLKEEARKSAMCFFKLLIPFLLRMLLLYVWIFFYIFKKRNFITYMLLSSNYIDLQILIGVEINIDYVRSEGRNTARSGGQYIRLKEAYFFFRECIFMSPSPLCKKCKVQKDEKVISGYMCSQEE